MDNTPIITQFDDQDAYKFYMQYAVVRHYPKAIVKYSFILRDPLLSFPIGFGEALKDQVRCFEDVRFTPETEEQFVRIMPWFDPSYIEYLRGFRFDPDEVRIHQNGGALSVTIEGAWHKTILWEVPLMACISELYYRFHAIPDDIDYNIPRWEEKFRAFEALNISVVEFGTRRRKSKLVQQEAIETFLKTTPGTIKGTSNVMFARKFGIKASGTQAHEWFMFHAAIYGIRMATKMALEKWIESYRGALGIALTDTYTTDLFFREFDLFFSKLFDGIRQDSGDPVAFAEKAIKHYQEKQIVLPSGLIPKTIIFSDSINCIERISSIENVIGNRILSSYGIGTWITNDIVGFGGRIVKPLNIVIKMSEARRDKSNNWISCFKLTDCKEKRTGNEEIIRKTIDEILKSEYQV